MATNHSEECRKRFAEELERVGDERLECEKRLIEHSKRRSTRKGQKQAKAVDRVWRAHRPRAGDVGRRSAKKQGRSSDSSGPEGATRKIGDGEQGESEARQERRKKKVSREALESGRSSPRG